VKPRSNTGNASANWFLARLTHALDIDSNDDAVTEQNLSLFHHPRPNCFRLFAHILVPALASFLGLRSLALAMGFLVVTFLALIMGNGFCPLRRISVLIPDTIPVSVPPWAMVWKLCGASPLSGWEP